MNYIPNAIRVGPMPKEFVRMPGLFVVGTLSNFDGRSAQNDAAFRGPPYKCCVFVLLEPSHEPDDRKRLVKQLNFIESRHIQVADSGSQANHIVLENLRPDGNPGVYRDLYIKPDRFDLCYRETDPKLSPSCAIYFSWAGLLVKVSTASLPETRRGAAVLAVKKTLNSWKQ
jgi:hypothetical protein